MCIYTYVLNWAVALSIFQGFFLLYCGEHKNHSLELNSCNLKARSLIVPYYLFAEGRAVATVATVSVRGNVPFLASNFGRAGAGQMTSYKGKVWIKGTNPLECIDINI